MVLVLIFTIFGKKRMSPHGKDFTYSHFKKERYHKNSEVSILTFVKFKKKKKNGETTSNNE